MNLFIFTAPSRRAGPIGPGEVNITNPWTQEAH
jgi:hypothetical protein